EHREKTAKRSLLALILAADFIGDPDGKFGGGEQDANVANHAAEVAVLEPRGKHDHQPLVFAQQFALAARPLDVGQRGERHNLPRWRDDGKLLDVRLVEAELVREAHTDGHGAIALAERGGSVAEQSGMGLERHLLDGHAQPARGHRVHVDHQLGIALLDSFVVHQTGNFHELRLELFRNRLQNVRAAAEKLHLHGFGRALEVTQHVLEDLGKFDVDPGEAGLDLMAQAAHDVINAAVALGAWLQFVQDVALVLLRGVEAHFRAGAAGKRGDAFRLRHHAFDLPHQMVGFRERGARRSEIVEHETALVHFGEKSGFQVRVEEHAEEDDHCREAGDQPRPPQRPAQRLLVDAVERRNEGCGFVPVTLRGQESLGEQRNQRHGEDQREQDGRSERDAERGKEIADHAGEQPEREKDDHGGERRAQHRPEKLSSANLGGAHRRLAQTEMPIDVFQYDHRIVNYQADGDRQPAERHQVQRATAQVHDEKGTDHGDRKRHGSNQSGFQLAQEDEQDDHGQKRADQDGVADAAHRFLDKFREVVDESQLQSGWDGGAGMACNFADLAGDVQYVASDLPRDVDKRGRLAVAGDQDAPVLGALADLGEVAEANGHAVFYGHHGVADLIEAGEQSRRDDEELRVILVQAADGGHAVGRAQPVGYIREGQTMGQGARRVHDHGNFTRVGGLHLDATHSRHAREHGPQVVIREVAQIGARHVAGENQAEDGEDGRGNALDDDFRLRRHPAARFADAGLDELQGILHVHLRAEKHGDFAGTANRLRADAADTEHGAHRFLDRPGDLEQHVFLRLVAGM